jgi:hypothetical protein
VPSALPPPDSLPPTARSPQNRTTDRVGRTGWCGNGRGEFGSGPQSGGCYVVVFTTATGEGWLARQVSEFDVPTEGLSIPKAYSPEAAAWLTDRLRTLRINIAHSHDFLFGVYGAWGAWRSGVPHVLTMHGSRYYASSPRRRLGLRAATAMSRHLVGFGTAP